MKNEDMPAMPIFDKDAKPCMVRDLDSAKKSQVPATGLTKREMFAINADASGVEFRDLESLGEFIGRNIDGDNINDLLLAQAQCSAKLKVVYADALLAELEA